MKNKLYIFASFSVLALWSCNSDKDITVQETTIVKDNSKPFIATTESYSPETKTSLNNGNVLWKTGDQVSIFAASTINDQYQVTDDSNGKTSASLNKISPSGFVAGVELDDNVAYYPYSASNEVAKNGSDYDMTVSLPSIQSYAENSFSNGAFPMAAVTNGSGDMNLTFKNVLGGLKLQLKGTATITRITVKGNNNEILYGDATVTASKSAVPSIVLSDASAKVVTLDCGAGVALDAETATNFIIALPPITMTGGFTVVVTDTEGKEMEIKTTRSQTIPRSGLLRMPVVTYEGITKDYSSDPFTITSIGNTSVSIVGIKDVYDPEELRLDYRKGNGSWTTYTMNTIIDLVNGETLQFKCPIKPYNSYFSDGNFHYNIQVGGSGLIEASGNIMSLLSSDMAANLSSYVFYGLFEDCSKLVRA